jgi:hypothetical protein
VTQSLRPFYMEARLKNLSLGGRGGGGGGGGGGSVLQKGSYYILNVERWLFVTKIWRSGVCNIARDTGAFSPRKIPTCSVKQTFQNTELHYTVDLY